MPTEQPTVALLTFNSPDSTAALATALAEGARVHLILPDNEVDYVAPQLDARVQTCPFNKPPLGRPWRQPRMCLNLVRRIRELDPDVVHIQQGHPVFSALLLGRLRRRFPLVLTIHDPLDRRAPRQAAHRLPRWRRWWRFDSAHRVIVHGGALVPGATRQGVAPERIHLVPRAAPLLADGARPETEDEPTLLFFGRIWPYKGLRYLVRAEPLISREVPRARIVIAGRGEKLALDPGRFELRNYLVSREERDELFARASVVVLPYVYASTSAVLALAYLHAKPVVVTSVGGLPDDVEPGRTGLVVPARDHVALAEAVVDLLRDRELRERLGAAGRRKLETENHPGLVARRTLEVYALARADFS